MRLLFVDFCRTADVFLYSAAAQKTVKEKGYLLHIFRGQIILTKAISTL